jgi:hypothetical protein
MRGGAIPAIVVCIDSITITITVFITRHRLCLSAVRASILGLGLGLGTARRLPRTLRATTTARVIRCGTRRATRVSRTTLGASPITTATRTVTPRLSGRTRFFYIVLCTRNRRKIELFHVGLRNGLFDETLDIAQLFAFVAADQ